MPEKKKIEIELECTVSGPKGPGLDAFIEEVLGVLAASLDIPAEELRKPVPETCGEPSA